ncbi:type 1 glutamine amidotransferase [Actinoplanes sp. CA-054009]
MRALAVQHDHLSPLGPVAARLAEHGFTVESHLTVPDSRFRTPNVEPAFPDFAEYDAVVVMGAPWSTYDEASTGRWVGAEITQLRRADAAGVPVLGICFGGQLLAAAHGGSVAASPSPEIGWATVESDDESVVPGGAWFEWHYDRWTLPPGAVEVARNGAASQAYVLRRNLAVQFHPEMTPSLLAGWLANGGAEQVGDPAALLSRTRAEMPKAAERARRLIDGFAASAIRDRAPCRRPPSRR